MLHAGIFEEEERMCYILYVFVELFVEERKGGTVAFLTQSVCKKNRKESFFFISIHAYFVIWSVIIWGLLFIRKLQSFPHNYKICQEPKMYPVSRSA